MGVALAAVLVIVAVALAAAVTISVEPRLARGEPGPARAPALDAAPRLPNADRWLYPAGAFAALAGVVLAAVVVPLGPSLIGQDLDIGVFYFIVVLDFVVLGIALTGWGANTPNAVESCYRAVAQLVAYVVPLGLALVGVIMMAKSLSTLRIVAAQRDLWFVVLQPIGFALYLVSGAMQAYRRPFVEPFAAAIEGGVLGVVGGGAALLWRIVLSGLLFLVAAMGAVLFLGGGSGPWLPAPAWMIVKTLGVLALMLLLGRRAPPLDVARMLALSWKLLIPVGLVNVLAVGVLILLHVGPA